MNSNHPLAASILHEAEKRGIVPIQASEVRNSPGVGFSGIVNGLGIAIVAPTYLHENDLTLENHDTTELAGKEDSVSYVLSGDIPIGAITEGDRIKPGAHRVIDRLKALGISPVLLTGDNASAARAIEDKVALMRSYRQEHHVVMMVGDGVNDAPSLAGADVGVAIGAGADVAVDAADIVLVRSNPADILHLLSLARNTYRKMVQNLWWGTGYNLVAIPLAAGLLAPWGVLLGPAAGAILMSLSTVVVALNALTLKID